MRATIPMLAVLALAACDRPEPPAAPAPPTAPAAPLPPVEPRPPGSPGALPDDRTPISEAPFTPQSAQGAANVVQTYYANIGMGRVAEAAQLRSDTDAKRLAAELSHYSEYHALVGAPGRIEGAAGSLFVEVPVQAYGRARTGAEVHQIGKAVLRRVNDVPGSTPEQRAWHIERIELKDAPPL